MKKLIVSLMALAMLLAMAVPAFADYASAQDGDLLYTVNFNGDDVLTPTLIVAKNTIMDITPSADGSELTVKGNGFKEDGTAKDQGVMWGGVFAGYNADATTQYTVEYQIWINENEGFLYDYGGTNCFIGVGGLAVDPSASSVKWLNFTSNYFTKNADERAWSLRSRSGRLTDADGNNVEGVFDPAMTAVKNDGYYTVRLTFDGPTATFTAYILTSGTGANAADWTKIAAAPYTVADTNQMGFVMYAQRSAIDAKIKNVKLYKGLVTGAESAPSNPETADTFTALPVALLVMSGAALAVILKKKEN